MGKKKEKIIKVIEKKKEKEELPKESKIEFDETILQIESQPMRVQEVRESVSEPVREEIVERNIGGDFRAEGPRADVNYSLKSASEESERVYASDEGAQSGMAGNTEEQRDILPRRNIGIFEERRDIVKGKERTIETERKYEEGKVKIKKRYPWQV